jgi:hypothetical protein
LNILFAIDVHGNKDALGDDERTAVRFNGTKEAASVAFVANTGTEGFDEEQQGIGVTIHANFPDAQDMATGFAFLPKAIAGAREKVNLAGALRLFKRLGVQVAEHQDFASLVILHDPGYQPTELFKCQFHNSLPKQKNPPRDSRQRAE